MVDGLQVTPLTPWNYGLNLPDDSKPDAVMEFVQDQMPQGMSPFHIPGVPVMIKAKVTDSSIGKFTVLFSRFGVYSTNPINKGG